MNDIKKRLATLSPKLLRTLPPSVQAILRRDMPRLIDVAEAADHLLSSKGLACGPLITVRRQHLERLCEAVQSANEELYFTPPPPGAA